MFDFERLKVYQKSKDFGHVISNSIIKTNSIDRVIKDQLRRASVSITLNIAEGCSRYSKADRRNFFVIARGSAYECVAIFDILKSENNIDPVIYSTLYSLGEEISKMLFTLEKGLK